MPVLGHAVVGWATAVWSTRSGASTPAGGWFDALRLPMLIALAYAPDIAGFVKTKIATLTPKPEKQLIAGIIYAMRTQMTRRGKMAFVALDDGEAQVEVAVFNEVYERHRDILREDQLLLIEGKVSKDDYSGWFTHLGRILVRLVRCAYPLRKRDALAFKWPGECGQA